MNNKPKNFSFHENGGNLLCNPHDYSEFVWLYGINMYGWTTRSARVYDNMIALFLADHWLPSACWRLVAFSLLNYCGNPSHWVKSRSLIFSFTHMICEMNALHVSLSVALSFSYNFDMSLKPNIEWLRSNHEINGSFLIKPLSDTL